MEEMFSVSVLFARSSIPCNVVLWVYCLELTKKKKLLELFHVFIHF